MRMRYVLVFLLLMSSIQAHPQLKPNLELPNDLKEPHLKAVTSFGQRCDWSHDGKRLIFLEKTFGDVYEVEIETGKLTPLTHHYFHEGYTRALYLANGDILLSGSRTFDATEPWKSRHHEQAELWVLKRDLSAPPTPLGVHCKEGPTASRKQMKIAWTIDDIYMAEIEYLEGGIPTLKNQKTIVRPNDLPGEIKGWRLETQNFRPPLDKELIFNAHYPAIEYEAEVMGIDLESKKIVNYSLRPDRYDEPEGIFPDGRHTLVESTRHHPKRGNKTTWDFIDIYKLALDGSGEMERLTFFNEGLKYKATNPVVSDDGRYMAFQYSVIGETTGIGHGIIIWDFEKYREQKH